MKQMVLSEVARAIYERTGVACVQASISNRHVHLSEQDIQALFGDVLHPIKDLSQPGQFACEETLTLEGPKGKIGRIRVLGPARKETQVEVTVTDCFKLGIKPVVRMSGDLKDSPGGVLVGPKGSVTLSSGVVVAARHIHLSAQEAEAFGLKDGDAVDVEKSGERGVVFTNVPVRCGKGHSIDFHLDTDEGNGALIRSGEILRMVKR